MAISYSSKLDIRGKAAEPVITEILFKNKTISEGLVRFETEVKAGTIFTENENTVVFQDYTCGAPSATGSFGLNDTEIVPVKLMTYQEFCYDNLRTSRFNQDMAAGAWNTISNEFDRLVIGSYADKIAYQAEVDFWAGISSTTKTAIAATPSGITASEQSFAAALTTTKYDGVVARLIYNKDKTAVTTKNLVVGATAGVTSANIATEYAKLYAAAPAVLLEQPDVLIYAPYSHKQLINIYNVSATYRDLFAKEGNSYFYNGVEIKFLPLPENSMVLHSKDAIVWATDLASDITNLMVDKIANNRDDYFVKTVFTSYAHVVNTKFAVLYIKGA
jgi:hypothetical protein